MSGLGPPRGWRGSNAWAAAPQRPDAAAIDPQLVREIAREHIRSGRSDIGITVELMLIGTILGREELAAWENAVQEAIRTAVVSWPDEKTPDELSRRFATTGDRERFAAMFGDKLDVWFTPEFAAYVRGGSQPEADEQAPDDSAEVWLADRNEVLRDQRDELAILLGRLVDHEDGPCRLDHHGSCQEHPGGGGDGCTTKAARELLAKVREQEGGES